MTSKLTIEQARRLRNDFECWQQDYDPKGDKEQYDMFGRGMAAMDMLIAGMYQEPVAYTDDRNLGYIDRGRETAYLWGKQNSETGDVPLYRHAQPAPVVPVVPDEMTMADAIMEIDAKDADRWTGRIGFQKGWNACRAAMLEAGTLTNEDTRQVDELTMWIKRLVRSLKNANPDSKLPREAMDYLTAKGLISVGDILR